MPIRFLNDALCNVTLQNKKREQKRLSKGSIIHQRGISSGKGTITFTTDDGLIYTVNGSDVVATDNKGNVLYPTKVRLTVPYLSQMDNELQPTGTCNVTCVAMCLKYYGIVGNGEGQLEDQINRWLLTQGLDRHNHDNLRLVFAYHKIKDTFKVDGRVEQIKEHLAGNNPVIIAGFFTQAGHIIVAVGYDEHGLIVHDPYGEYFEEGYEVGDCRNGYGNGAYLHYSYGLINRLCNYSGIWAHFPSK